MASSTSLLSIQQVMNANMQPKDELKFLIMIYQNCHDKAAIFNEACSLGLFCFARYMVKNGIQRYVNLKENNNGLRCAAKSGHHQIVSLLLGNGAVDIGDQGFKDSIENGYYQCVALFIKFGANVIANNNFALKWASHLGHLKTVEVLIKNGAVVTPDCIDRSHWLVKNHLIQVYQEQLNIACKLKINELYQIAKEESNNLDIEITKFFQEINSFQ